MTPNVWFEHIILYVTGYVLLLKKQLPLHLQMFVCLCLSGNLPDVSKATHVTVPLVEDLQDNCWEAKIVEQKGKNVKLSVNSHPAAAIGKYRLSVVTRSPTGEAMSPHSPDNDIYVLFNPWCEGTNQGGVIFNDNIRTYTYWTELWCDVIWHIPHKVHCLKVHIKAQILCLLLKSIRYVRHCISFS